MRNHGRAGWRRAAALLGLLGALAWGSAAQASSILENGSFEEIVVGPGVDTSKWITFSAGSSALVGWEIIGNSVDSIGPAIWTASDGERSLDLAGTAPGGIRQTFATLTGHAYLVTFDLSGNPGGSDPIKRLQVSADGQSQIYEFDTTGQSRPGITWVGQNFAFVASGTSVTLEFLTLDPQGAWGPALDNVDVHVMPEPSTALLLAAGMAGLALGRRRRSTLS